MSAAELIAAWRTEAAAGIKAAAEHSAADLRKSISIPVGRNKGRKIRSKPGEPPRKETGRLYGSVRSKADGLTGEVSESTHYAGYLEDGTSKMAKRPHVSPAFLRLVEAAPEIVLSKIN